MVSFEPNIQLLDFKSPDISCPSDRAQRHPIANWIGHNVPIFGGKDQPSPWIRERKVHIAIWRGPSTHDQANDRRSPFILIFFFFFLIVWQKRLRIDRLQRHLTPYKTPSTSLLMHSSHCCNRPLLTASDNRVGK